MGHSPGTTMNIRAIALHGAVRTVALKLLAGIEASESAQSVNMAGQRAEGFVLGLEAACALKVDVIENIYIGFSTAVSQRIAALQSLEP